MKHGFGAFEDTAIVIFELHIMEIVIE